MMKRKAKKIVAMGMLVCMIAITGCSSNTTDPAVTKVEGLENFGDISVITREEGSGTREVFAQKVGLLEAGKNTGKDLIIKDAEIAMNAETVISQVASNEAAIGFVSLGALTKQQEKIKVVKVNGIEPNTDTIKKGSYELSRNFNLGYSGKLTGVKNDFINYILSAGQGVVTDGYISVKNTTSFLSDKSKGTLEISGSTSVAPLMEKLVKGYSKINKNAAIQISTSDSTSGLTAAMQGSSDFGMASRELKDYEKELLEYQTIAKDGVVVIVNEKNPVENLTIGQLYDIFSGSDKKWSDTNQ